MNVGTALANVGKGISKMVKKNNGQFFTIASIVGLVTTVGLTVQAVIKTTNVLDEEMRRHNEEVSNAALSGDDRDDYYDSHRDIPVKERFRLSWKCWIGVSLSFSGTVASILAKQKVTSDAIAAMASVIGYKARDQSATQRAIDKLDEAEKKHLEKAKAEEVASDVLSSGGIIDIDGPGNPIIVDQISGLAFRSSRDRIENAVKTATAKSVNSKRPIIAWEDILAEISPALVGNNMGSKAQELFAYTTDNPPGDFSPNIVGYGDDRIPVWVLRFSRQPLLVLDNYEDLGNQYLYLNGYEY